MFLNGQYFVLLYDSSISLPYMSWLEEVSFVTHRMKECQFSIHKMTEYFKTARCMFLTDNRASTPCFKSPGEILLWPSNVYRLCFSGFLDF